MRRPDTIKRKGGVCYQARYRDQHGRQRCKTFQTKKEANAFLIESARLRADGMPVNTTMRFDELAPEWLTSNFVNLSESSKKDYKEAIGRLYRFFGSRFLKSISPSDIEQFRESELASIRAAALTRLERRKLTAEEMERAKEHAAIAGVRSVNKAVATLRSMFRLAQGRRYIAFNPAEHVRKLRTERRKDEALDANILSPSELQHLVAHTVPDWRASLMVLGYGGLRLGEMLGLGWDDCDFASNRIRVQRQLEASTGGLRAPKTRAGTRLVELPSFVMHELKVWKLRCPKGEHALCFPASNGSPMNADNFRHRIFRPALRRAGLRRIRVHDLRHGAASMLIATGADIATISRQLGHANVSITLATYTHAFAKRAEPGLGSKLESFLARESGRELVANSNSAG